MSEPLAVVRTNLHAMGLVFLSTLGFSAVHGVVRHLSTELHAYELAFFRNFFGMLLLLPLFLRHGFAPLTTQRFGLHLLRVALMAASLVLFFQALTLAPLAKVIALGFTGPIFTTLLGVLVLRERVGAWRWSAIVIGFIGAMVVVRPQDVGLDLGAMLTLLSSLLFALGLLLVRVLCATESTATLTVWSILLMTPMTLLPALPVWTWPGIELLGWLVLMGVLASLSLLAFTAGMRLGETSVVMPVDYFRLLWGAAIGYLFFEQVPDAATWLGGTIIFASAGIIAWREYRARG